MENKDAAVKDLWQRAKTIFLSTLQKEEEKSQAERQLAMIISVGKKNNTLTLFTSNDFAANIIRNTYTEKIKSCLVLAGSGDALTIEVKVDENAMSKELVPEKPKRNSPVKTQEAKKEFVSTMPLNPEYTFEEFVRGPSNSYVYAAAKGVVASPGKRGFNPMFIHGQTGLGKTHIMQAIGNAIKAKNPNASVCYLTAERLMYDYVNAMTSHTVIAFRERYRNVDVLLVDDIQFLGQKREFQEEYFNTFFSLYAEGKQIVMTSDVAPKNLPSIDERLIGRFESGMVQEIEQPGYETRLAILKKKAEALNTNLPNNFLEFIASKIKSHVRALEGALSKVNLFYESDRTMSYNETVLNNILKDFIEREQSRKKLTVEEVQTAVAKKFQVTIGQILSPERTQSLVTPRQIAMYIARKFTTKSLPEIAIKFEKSHATVLHGVKNIEKRMDVEPDLKNNLEEILTDLGLSLSDKME